MLQLRASWNTCLKRLDAELGLKSTDKESYVKRGLNCPSFGRANRKLDIGCHLRFCPYCWARRTAIPIWQHIYQALHGLSCNQFQLIWLEFKLGRPRCSSPVGDVIKLQKWLNHPESKLRHEPVRLLRDNGSATVGSLVTATMWPEEHQWMYRQNNLMLVPKKPGLLQRLRDRDYPDRAWHAHDDWSRQGLIRLMGRLCPYPYPWLHASGEDWLAFREHCKHLRMFTCKGVFKIIAKPYIEESRRARPTTSKKPGR